MLQSFGYRYNVPYRLHATLKSLRVIDNEYLLFRRLILQSIKLALPLDPTPLFHVAQQVLLFLVVFLLSVWQEEVTPPTKNKNLFFLLILFTVHHLSVLFEQET
jgi:hypothetical protein